MLSSNIIMIIINNQCMRGNTVLGLSLEKIRRRSMLSDERRRRRRRTVRTYLILYVDNNECE